MAENTLDDLFTITCCKCRQAAPVHRWRSTELLGELPAGEFQCPHCRTAFVRRHIPKARWPYKTIELAPIASRL